MILVEITPQTHQVIVDVKYASADNFTGKPAYKRAALFLHPDAEQHLRAAVRIADGIGLKLKLFDGFRPTEVQEAFWAHTPDPHFLAPPDKGSPHSRGVAIDLTLCRADGSELDMGTAFDAFTPLSHHGRTDVNAEAQRNRILLMGIMTAAGWDFYRNEWWHYQLFGSRSYALLSDKQAGTNLL